MATLWPPLAQVQAELLGSEFSGRTYIPAPINGAAATEAPMFRHEASAASGSEQHLTGPLLDLAQRRQAARARFRDRAWEPGCVVLVRQGTSHLGVLLDLQDDSGKFWNGWLTTAEPDWAGWHDVLLEPGDQPTDPSVAVIQAWNRVRVPPPGGQTSNVLAHMSPQRLAAVRAVWSESLKPTTVDTEPMPGRVALRDTAEGHMVLTGTPLATDDPRQDHQSLYSELGRRLIETCQSAEASERAGASLAPQAQRAPDFPDRPAPGQVAAVAGPASWWGRILDTLRPDTIWRPAFALLVLVVVGQQWMLWQGGNEDEVRFRGGTLPASETPSLVVRWQPGVRMEEAQALLNSLQGQHDLTVLPDGSWLITPDDPGAARARLSESPLVKSVEGP